MLCLGKSAQRVSADCAFGGADALLAASYVGSSNASPKSPDVPGAVATVSGTVHAPSDFKAGKVYFTNTDRNMTYMVYTTKGKYKAMRELMARKL